MSELLKRALDARARAWSEAQDIRERAEREKRDLTTEEDETYTRALDEVEKHSKVIENEERAAKLEGLFAPSGETRAPVPTADESVEDRSEAAYAKAFGVYMREGISGLNREERDLLQKGHVELDGEARALAGGSGSTGGYLIPTETLRKMTDAMKMFGGLLGVSNLVTTQSGNPLQWPTNNDTSNVGALLSDNTQLTEQDLAFGQNDLSAYTYTSKLMRVPWQLLQDEVFNLEAFVGKKAGERIGRAVAAHLATGDGSAKPTGLFAAATSGATAAGATAVTLDDLINLEHSVDPAYRMAGRCRFVLNDNSIKSLRKLKDSNGQYLWQPSVQAGVPSMLHGYPYTIDQGIADIATGAKAVGFGDVESAFTVRQVAGGHLVVLRERYADYLQNGYFAFQRFDSSLDDSGAFKVLTQA